MRTVYLIGNGFDINLGLPTKYTDFYRYYLGLDRSNDSKNVSKLKEHLSQCLSSREQYWSDLEEAMGQYTTELDSFAELEEVYDSLNENMQKYIESVENTMLPDGIDIDLLKKNLLAPHTFLPTAQQNIINSIYTNPAYDSHHISIVNFNYTTTIEKILNFEGNPIVLGNTTYHNGFQALLENVYHIHGCIDAPILGINDASQIFNEKLRTNIDTIEYLVKPKINSNLGHLIDQYSQHAINNAQLICIYGLSLGKTDGLWWQLIGERLLKGVTLILFVFDENNPNIAPRKRGHYNRLWQSRLCDAAGIQNKHRESIMPQIIVAPNTNMFNIR